MGYEELVRYRNELLRDPEANGLFLPGNIEVDDHFFVVAFNNSNGGGPRVIRSGIYLGYAGAAQRSGGAPVLVRWDGALNEKPVSEQATFLGLWDLNNSLVLCVSTLGCIRDCVDDRPNTQREACPFPKKDD